MKDKTGGYCEECNKFVKNFKYKTCCNSFDCICVDLSAAPCICSENCWNNFIKKIKKALSTSDWDK